MCGIGGIYRASETPLPVQATLSLWKALEGRGTDASGFALHWLNSDKPVIVKQPGATGLLQNRLSQFMGDGTTTHYVLLHTRFTTQGSTENNDNNHPVVRDGIVVTHNGVLSNDREVFEALGVSPTADVDTEAINAALRCESPGWALDNITGSMSVAWVDSSTDSDKVHLMTNGRNPLVIARTTDNHIVWASTIDILDESDFEIKSYFHAQPFKVYTLSPDGGIRSDFVSEQRSHPNIGWFPHAASRKPYSTSSSQWGWKPKQPKSKRKNKRRGVKKDKSSPRSKARAEWVDRMEKEGFVEVWRNGSFRWVPKSEVTL
tara:strand:+ start:3328 stop:4281 length:954 start_codon:yes stop_codon:yes gene_type:complete